MNWKIFPLRTWLMIGAILLVCVLFLSWCGSRRDAETARDQATIGDARTSSAVEAIDAIGANTAANDQTHALVEDIQNEIREAAPADRDRIARCGLRELQGLDPC